MGVPMEELTPRQLLQALVGFPTVSTGSNLDLVDWLEGYLAGHGIAAHRHWNEDRSKAALFAHVGPKVAGGVVLSGHSDVVPVEGQVWTSDPWVVTERDGRLYGRGGRDLRPPPAPAPPQQGGGGRGGGGWGGGPRAPPLFGAGAQRRSWGWRGPCNWHCLMMRSWAAPAP